MAPIKTNQETSLIEGQLGDDILEGIAGITRWWFGNDTESNKKKIANHIDNKGLPIFRVGRSIFARKSVLLDWIKEQEELAKGGARKTRAA